MKGWMRFNWNTRLAIIRFLLVHQKPFYKSRVAMSKIGPVLPCLRKLLIITRLLLVKRIDISVGRGTEQGQGPLRLVALMIFMVMEANEVIHIDLQYLTVLNPIYYTFIRRGHDINTTRNL